MYVKGRAKYEQAHISKFSNYLRQLLCGWLFSDLKESCTGIKLITCFKVDSKN